MAKSNFSKIQNERSNSVSMYGWIPSLPDYRDYTWTPPKMANLPTSVDLRPQMPPVYHQGSLGSCTAQTLGALLQYDEIKQGKFDPKIPSRLFIYYNSRVLMNSINSDSGASMRCAIQSINYFGYCPEPLWLYDTTKYKTKPPPISYTTAVPHKVSSYERINQDITHIKIALSSALPIAFGFVVYQNFELQNVSQTGILLMPSGSVRGGHAVLAVGYDDADQTVLCRNSWGDGWGMQGYFKMPYNYISNPSLAMDFWTVSFVP